MDTKDNIIDIAKSQPFNSDQEGCDKLQDILNNPQHTDMGNAARLVKLYQDAIRWCPDFNHWLVWNGKYWEHDRRGKIFQAAQRTISNMIIEAGAMETGRDRTALLKWAIQSQAFSKVQSMVTMARYHEGIPILQEELDLDNEKLQLENGTLNLRSGDLLNFEQGDYITKTSPATYDSGARAPRWEQFLREVMPDAETVDFLQRSVGYSLSGDVSARAFFVLYGLGRNGKSTFLSVVQHLLGDYACTTPVDTLMRKWGASAGGIPNDLAALRGQRFVTAFESGASMHLDEGKVKQMVGGDPISARFMRAEFFTFMPAFKIFLCTNHKPVIRGVDAAIWDRIKLVPFNIRITEAQEDTELKGKLLNELPGILNWALQGYQNFKNFGLGACSEVVQATAAYRADQDVIRSFLEQYYALDVASKVRSSQVYEDYKGWAEQEGEKIMSSSKLKAALNDRGIRYKRESDGRFYLGLMNKLEEV